MGASEAIPVVAMEPRLKAAIFLAGGLDAESTYLPEIEPLNFAPFLRLSGQEIALGQYIELLLHEAQRAAEHAAKKASITYPMDAAPTPPSTVMRTCRHLIRRTGPCGLAVVILITVCVGAALAKTSEEIVHVPIRKPVMVDGKIGREERSDAAEVKMPSGGRLYIKVAGEFAYLAVGLPATRSGFTDLYIASQDGSIYDLHASAKLGERELQGGKWPEWRNWWNNRGWIANVSQVGSFEKKTFMPANIREYQIERSRFVGHEWRLMLEMSMESQGGEYTVVRFPASASDSNSERWLKIQFSP